MNVPESLISLIERHLDTSGFQIDSSLAQAGLDSLALVGLLVDVEDTYGVTIPDELLSQESFATPRVLWATIVAAKKG
ncbi:D-alanine--poly(phosphoribitol) ligase subunit 2 [Microbacterium azadirachtae]|uniref:D-alanine--poly(Phosphoribitol) ligase subunit 2 n=1 Tax=Microbacterium azadirachtae TaxID=582680 RepID=A0A0F0KTS4_9MICO|nr:phosphopantetheine-binding protein [Microbacterium azadirachtae]KJL23884.1 D-alanine--poly(phosphoribitol) ligase subunit 2 [Microbacterium azadirachtae]